MTPVREPRYLVPRAQQGRARSTPAIAPLKPVTSSICGMADAFQHDQRDGAAGGAARPGASGVIVSSRPHSSDSGTCSRRASCGVLAAASHVVANW